jgi:hypothetical protein
VAGLSAQDGEWCVFVLGVSEPYWMYTLCLPVFICVWTSSTNVTNTDIIRRMVDGISQIGTIVYLIYNCASCAFRACDAGSG